MLHLDHNVPEGKEPKTGRKFGKCKKTEKEQKEQGEYGKGVDLHKNGNCDSEGVINMMNTTQVMEKVAIIIRKYQVF